MANLYLVPPLVFGARYSHSNERSTAKELRSFHFRSASRVLEGAWHDRSSPNPNFRSLTLDPHNITVHIQNLHRLWKQNRKKMLPCHIPLYSFQAGLPTLSYFEYTGKAAHGISIVFSLDKRHKINCTAKMNNRNQKFTYSWAEKLSPCNWAFSK